MANQSLGIGPWQRVHGSEYEQFLVLQVDEILTGLVPQRDLDDFAERCKKALLPVALRAGASARAASLLKADARIVIEARGGIVDVRSMT